MELRRYYDQSTGLRIEKSGCKHLKRSLCCVLGQDSLLSQCLSPGHSGVDMSTAEIVKNTQQNAGGERGNYDGLASHPGEKNPARGLPHKKDGDIRCTF